MIDASTELKACRDNLLRPTFTVVAYLQQSAGCRRNTIRELEAHHGCVRLRACDARVARGRHARVHDPAVTADAGCASERAESACAGGPGASAAARGQIASVVKADHALNAKRSDEKSRCVN